MGPAAGCTTAQRLSIRRCEAAALFFWLWLRVLETATAALRCVRQARRGYATRRRRARGPTVAPPAPEPRWRSHAVTATPYAGEALFNGAPPNAALRDRVGYVLQTDFLLPFLTVRETLRFAARLRLPASRSAADKRAVVEALILELCLKDVADTRVGGQRVRGISGGEARRVTAACQLVTDPALLYCDEPTTGLDAFTTRNLVETLAAVAARGRTVLATMHQPRADVLVHFGATLLLSKGRAAYFGPTAEMVPYFASLGFVCPEHTNPGDFFLDLSSVDLRTPAAEAATRHRVEALLAAWAGRVTDGGAAEAAAGAASKGAAAAAAAGALLLADVPRAGAASPWEQAAVLFQRGVLNTARDALMISGLLTESVVIAVAIGAIFYGLDGSPGAMISRSSLAYLVGSLQTYQFLVFCIYQLCAELAVYDHETADGMYGVLPYVAARYGVLLPQMLVFPTLFSLIVYNMAGLRPEGYAQGVFIVVMFAVHMIGFSLALVCVAAQRSFPQASLMANSLYTFMGLTSGLLVQLESVPIWLAWIKSISFLNFSFRTLAAVEFRDRTWPCPAPSASPVCAAYDGNAQLARLGVDRDITFPFVALGVNFAVLVVMAILVLALRPRIATRLQAAMLPLRPGGEASEAAPLPGHSANGEVVVAVPDESEAEPDAAGTVPRAESLHFRAFTPTCVSLRNVGLVLRPRRRMPCSGAPESRKVILAHISLEFASSQFTGIMGASGSGKSSLLNALAARVRRSEAAVSGAVLFNSAPLAPEAARAVVGYVTQHDALLPLLTVVETLDFAARLRLPESMSVAKKRARVQVVIAELGLKECANTMIGADAGAAAEGGASGATASRARGVSGGEKRRVSIAQQLLTDPAVLLLDEPTSGLDAFTALNIGATLARLAAQEGRTVVATLHQPREGLFAMLQQFVLLAQGRIVYAGPGGDAVLRYFEARGCPFPPRTNPADCVVDAACVDLRNAEAEAATRARVAALIDAYAAFAAGCGDDGPDGRRPRLSDTVTASAADVQGMARPTASLAATTPLLLRRSAINLARQPGVLAARLMQSVSFGIILCIFYTRLRHDYRSVQNRIGLLYELMALIFVGMLNCIAVFPAERNVFYRECADGTYGTAAFLLSYTALEVPGEIASSLVFAVMVGPIAGLQSTPRQFFKLTYMVFCVINAGESIGIAFCALIYHIGFSVTIASLSLRVALLPRLLTRCCSQMSVFLSVWSVMSGFFSIGMPLWLQTVNHASVLKYAGNLIAVNEFKGLKLQDGLTGDAVLSLYRFHPDEATRDVVLLGALTLAYRLLAAWALDANKGRHI